MKRTVGYILFVALLLSGAGAYAEAKPGKNKVKEDKVLQEKHKNKHKNKATKFHYKANQLKRKHRHCA